MDNKNYRELRFFKKRTQVAQQAVPSLLKQGTLLFLAIQTYRQSTHFAARVLALLVGAKALSKITSPLLFPKTLLLVNEEGIRYDPALPFFKGRVSMAWEEIATISLCEVTLINSSPAAQTGLSDPTLLTRFLGRKNAGASAERPLRLLSIVPKDIDAFKRSRGFQRLDTFGRGRNLLEIDVSRLLSHFFLVKVGTPFLLLEQALPIPLEELFDAIRNTFADIIQENAISILDEQKVTVDLADQSLGTSRADSAV